MSQFLVLSPRSTRVPVGSTGVQGGGEPAGEGARPNPVLRAAAYRVGARAGEGSLRHSARLQPRAEAGVTSADRLHLVVRPQTYGRGGPDPTAPWGLGGSQGGPLSAGEATRRALGGSAARPVRHSTAGLRGLTLGPARPELSGSAVAPGVPSSARPRPHPLAGGEHRDTPRSRSGVGGFASPAPVGGQKFCAPRATCSYSCMRPPRRSGRTAR